MACEPFNLDGWVTYLKKMHSKKYTLKAAIYILVPPNALYLDCRMNTMKPKREKLAILRFLK
jgi:hypothetical protein